MYHNYYSSRFSGSAAIPLLAIGIFTGYSVGKCIFGRVRVLRIGPLPRVPTAQTNPGP